MHGMFERAKFFNQPLDAWNVWIRVEHSCVRTPRIATPLLATATPPQVSSVRHMGQMFYQAGSFDQSLKAWNVRQLRRSDAMFYEAEPTRT